MPVADVERTGVRLNYEVRGVGNLSITLAACAGYTFDFQQAVEKYARVLSYDARGSGKSTAPKELSDYHSGAYLQDWVTLSTQAGFQRSACVAYSHSGYFACDYALHYPKRVSALVLIEPAIFVDRGVLEERVAVARANGHAATELLVDQIAPHLLEAPKERESLIGAIKEQYPDAMGQAGEWHARALRPITEAHLRRLSVPTLVIGGSESRSSADVERVAHAIPNASVWWVQGGTHLLLNEKPGVAAEISRLFIEQVEAAER